jgi:hypothetical protein
MQAFMDNFDAITAVADGVAAPPVHRRLGLPPDTPPILTIVIDTEEEFDWSAPFNAAHTDVTNIAEQERAQDVFDRYGAVPTYVITYPVATTPEAAQVLHAFRTAGRCDIGAHLHPWVTPPAEGPVDAHHSYPGNLPPRIEARKLAALTDAITERFGARPTIYKAGRYGIGRATPAFLQQLGYRIDVSVVPHTEFLADGGPDFRGAPDGPYEIAPGLCEVPLSVHFVGPLAPWGPALTAQFSSGLARRVGISGICQRLGLLSRLRLSPEGHALSDLTRQTRAAFRAGTRLFMLTYHSSSLLPGATPYVHDTGDRAHFVDTLDGYLRFFHEELGGQVRPVGDVTPRLTFR